MDSGYIYVLLDKSENIHALGVNFRVVFMYWYVNIHALLELGKYTKDVTLHCGEGTATEVTHLSSNQPSSFTSIVETTSGHGSNLPAQHLSKLTSPNMV